MQMTCPCCSRTINTYPSPLNLSALTRNFINDALEDKFFNDCFNPDQRYSDTRIVEDLETEREAPELDIKEARVVCLCGAAFNLRTSLRLDKVELQTSLAKNWLTSELKDKLNIREYHAPASTSWHNTPANTGYHGASVPGCSHNYMFQRNTYNGTIVRCSKCGHEKTM